MGNLISNVPVPRPKPELPSRVAEPNDAANNPAATAAAEKGYRGVSQNTSWSAPEQGFTAIRDKGFKGLQNDLVNGLYYDVQNPQALGETHQKEFDGKFGPRTKTAVSRLQEDLKAAKLYDGEAHGGVDGGTAKALEKLKQGGALPEGLDPATRARLDRFRSSAGQPPKVMELKPEESSFAAARPKGPVDLKGETAAPQEGGPVDPGKVVENMTRLLGNKVNPSGEMAAPQRLAESAKLAESLSTDPNIVQKLNELGGRDQLGFDPNKSDPNVMRELMRQQAGELKEQAMLHQQLGTPLAWSLQKGELQSDVAALNNMKLNVQKIQTPGLDPAKRNKVLAETVRGFSNDANFARQVAGNPNLSDFRAKEIASRLLQQLEAAQPR